jgi:hypothetical protein
MRGGKRHDDATDRQVVETALPLSELIVKAFLSDFTITVSKLLRIFQNLDTRSVLPKTCHNRQSAIL